MERNHRLSHRLSHVALAVGALSLTLLVWPSQAAGHDKYDKHHGKGHVIVKPPYHVPPGHYYGNGHGHRRFAVPRVIHSHHYKTYKPYYYGRAYYAPHRHHHAIYSFPVYGYYGGPVYQPYAYCGNEFFAGGVFTEYGPRFSFGFSIVR